MARRSDIIRSAYETYYGPGGVARGVDPEVAADLGYVVPEDVTESYIKEAAASLSPEELTETVRNTGAAVCGDCLEVIPCQHIREDRNGRRYTVGY